MRFLSTILPILFWATISGFQIPGPQQPVVASSTRATTFLASSSLDSLSSKDDSPDDENEQITSSNEKIFSNQELVEDSSSTAVSNEDEVSEGDMPDQASSQDIMSESDSKISKDLLSSLLLIASSSGRGEFATTSQKDQALSLIEHLEKKNPTPQPTDSPLIQGRWELLYSSTQLFRSSPFFMAGRAVCSTPEKAQQYDWFCDMHREALAMSRIGAVRQIISETRIISEFEVKAGTVPFLSDFTPFSYSGGLPVTIDGAIVSSADITPVDNGEAWEVFMDTVEIKGSNIPGLRQLLDGGLKLRSRDLGQFLVENLSGYTNPKPVFKTTYLDETLRIARDQDGKVFVYAKVSNDTTATDYRNAMPDYGLTKLLEGFNDAVTKLYL